MSDIPTATKILYPIVPIIVSYSDVIDDIDNISHVPSISNYLTAFVRAVAIENAHAPSSQNEEILAILQNPESKVEVRKLKKTSYTYHRIPQKVRDNIPIKYPITFGTACGINKYRLIRIYLFMEDEYAEKWGFHKGDMILDTRTYVPHPFYRPKIQKIPKMKPPPFPPSQSQWTEEEEDDEVIPWILPVETHCVMEKMYDSLYDFITITQLPLLSVSISRTVKTNRGGGLEASPQWNGVVVSPSIRDALKEPLGEIYQKLKEKKGVHLKIEECPLCPNVVGNSGMVLLSQISW